LIIILSYNQQDPFTSDIRSFVMLLEISIVVPLQGSSVHSTFHSMNFKNQLSIDKTGETNVDAQSPLPVGEKKVQNDLFCLRLLRRSVAHKKLIKSV
jgi:hypothetical protein